MHLFFYLYFFLTYLYFLFLHKYTGKRTESHRTKGHRIKRHKTPRTKNHRTKSHILYFFPGGQKVTIYIFYSGGQKFTGQKVTTYIFADTTLVTLRVRPSSSHLSTMAWKISGNLLLLSSEGDSRWQGCVWC